MAPKDKVIACLVVILVTLSISCNLPGNESKKSETSAEIRIIPIEQSLSYDGREWSDGTLFMSAKLSGFSQCPESPVFHAEILQNPKYTGYLNGLYAADYIRNGNDVNDPRKPLYNPSNPENCYYEQIIQDAFSKSIFNLPENGVCGIDKLTITFDVRDGESNHVWNRDFSCSELNSVLFFQQSRSATPTLTPTRPNTPTPTIAPTPTLIPGFVRFQGTKHEGSPIVRINDYQYSGVCIDIDKIIDPGDDNLKIGDTVCLWAGWDATGGCYNTHKHNLQLTRWEFYGGRLHCSESKKVLCDAFDYDLCMNQKSYLIGIRDE